MKKQKQNKTHKQEKRKQESLKTLNKRHEQNKLNVSVMLYQQIKCSEISVKWLENIGVESLSWDSVLFLSLASFSFLGSLLNFTIQLKGIIRPTSQVVQKVK